MRKVLCLLREERSLDNKVRVQHPVAMGANSYGSAHVQVSTVEMALKSKIAVGAIRCV